MCQLLAISSTVPTPIFSSSLLSPFVQRGGNTDVHSHGWGVAYSNYCDNQKKLRLKTIRDTSPAATSEKVQSLIKNQSDERIFETQTLLAHIRYATVGKINIDNVHPFHREIFGVEFVFAHNGDVPMFYSQVKDKEGHQNGGGMHSSVVSSSSSSSSSLSDFNDYDNIHEQKVDYENLSDQSQSQHYHKFQPFGETDSERVFCYILNALDAKYDTFPSLEELYHTIHQLCTDIVHNNQDQVILNFILGVGDHIFAYSWPGRRPGSTTWNGLYYMLQSNSNNSNSSAQVAVIATKPLETDTPSLWVEFNRGDFLLFSHGTLNNICYNTLSLSLSLTDT